MGYAGNDYGSNGAWNGNGAGAAGAGQSLSNLSTSHASAVVVLGSLAILIALRMGFRGVSVGGVNVGVR
jgi:hypothetical protein